MLGKSFYFYIVLTEICISSKGYRGWSATFLLGDRAICKLGGRSIQIYLLWISSAFVVTTLTVFSNHQLSCQINELFYCECCCSSSGNKKHKWKGIRFFFPVKTSYTCRAKRGQAIKASARANRITWMTHFMYFTLRRKRGKKNMWKFNDPKRNVVFRKVKTGQQVTEMSEAKTVKMNCGHWPWEYVFNSIQLFLASTNKPKSQHACVLWRPRGYQISYMRLQESLWSIAGVLHVWHVQRNICDWHL